MSMEATFESKEVMDFLKNIKKRLKGVQNGEKKFVGILSSIVYADIIRHFENEQGSKSSWAPWSKSYTEALKIKGRSGNKKLQYSGKLRNNISPISKGGNFRKTSDGFLWYNNAKTSTGFPYAAAHDVGGPKLPQRDFMWLSDKAMDNILQGTLKFMFDEGV